MLRMSSFLALSGRLLMKRLLQTISEDTYSLMFLIIAEKEFELANSSKRYKSQASRITYLD
jgi:hypothetical protein